MGLHISVSSSVLAVAAPSAGATPAAGQLALHTKSTGPRQAARLPSTLTRRAWGPGPARPPWTRSHTSAQPTLPAGATARRRRGPSGSSQKLCLIVRLKQERAETAHGNPRNEHPPPNAPTLVKHRKRRDSASYANVHSGFEGRAGRRGDGPLRPCTPLWPPRRAAPWGRLVSLPGHLLF